MCTTALQEELSTATANSGAAGQLQQTVQEQAANISSLQVRCSSQCQLFTLAKHTQPCRLSCSSFAAVQSS
jgi:hypothetical protein